MHERILIIKLGALGDIIMAAGAIHDIRNQHQDAELTVLTTGPYKKIFERCPWVDKIVLDPRDPRWRLDLMRQLKGRVDFDSYDMIYDLQKVKRSNFYHRWFVKKASWSGKAPGCSHYFQMPKYPISVQDEFVLQLQTSGVQVEYTRKPDLEWFVEDAGSILSEANVNQPYIVLMPGSSSGQVRRRWPYYGELAQLLIDSGFCVLTVPGPDDLETCLGIPGIMLTGDQEYLNYFYLAGVLEKAAFVVGNDSGPSHIAANLGVPGIALFGKQSKKYMKNMKRKAFACLFIERLEDLTPQTLFAEIAERMSSMRGG